MRLEGVPRAWLFNRTYRPSNARSEARGAGSLVPLGGVLLPRNGGSYNGNGTSFTGNGLALQSSSQKNPAGGEQDVAKHPVGLWPSNREQSVCGKIIAQGGGNEYSHAYGLLWTSTKVDRMTAVRRSRIADTEELID
jgi:hypothetical protein